VFVTGAAGFIGAATARLLRARDDEVVAVVRDPSKATMLQAIGATIEPGDLGSESAIRSAMIGCDAVIHLAGSYRVGIAASERQAMYEVNVAVTERVLDVAIELGVPRIVAVSTVNVFGDTKGRIVTESHRRDPADGFLSYYDETKYRAHVAAVTRIAAGDRIVIAMPGTTYGPVIIQTRWATGPFTRDGALCLLRRCGDLADLRRRPGRWARRRAGPRRMATPTSWRARTCSCATRSGSSPMPQPAPAIVTVPNGLIRFAARTRPARTPARVAAEPGEIVRASSGDLLGEQPRRRPRSDTVTLERPARDAYGRP
jgi:NAD(P)-dependent dehydrogenase (short-subunit alcohol dehydrogenase family)